jgi:type III secretion protein Q
MQTQVPQEDAYEQPAETLSVDDEGAAQDEAAAVSEPGHEEALGSIAQLPLSLTVRCGQLILSIEQLRRLGSGSVLEIHGVAPGRASLYHGDYVVGEGELVDVDGRLGLQITRMSSLS